MLSHDNSCNIQPKNMIYMKQHVCIMFFIIQYNNQKPELLNQKTLSGQNIIHIVYLPRAAVSTRFVPQSTLKVCPSYSIVNIPVCPRE